MGVRSLLLSLLDFVVVQTAELIKAWLREVFRLCQQLVLAFSAVIVQISNNNKYYAARRNRIHQGCDDPPVKPSRGLSGFAKLLLHLETGDAAQRRGRSLSWSHNPSENDSAGDRKVVRMSPSPRKTAKERFSDILSETSAATCRPFHRRILSLSWFCAEFVSERVMNMLVLAVMWIPGMGSRAERLAKMLDEQEENFKVREFDLNDEAPTGLFEDSQLRLILFVDWFAWTCRYCLYYVLGGGGANVLHKLQHQHHHHNNLSLRHFRAHQPRRRALNFSAAVERVGYPFEQLYVRTADGYRLELHRLPRPASDKVMFLQHGIMDSSYSFVAKGASDGLAFRAFDKGFDVFMGNFRGTSSLKHASDDISARDYWDYSLDDHGNHDLDAFVREIWRIKLRDLSLAKDRRELRKRGAGAGGGGWGGGDEEASHSNKQEATPKKERKERASGRGAAEDVTELFEKEGAAVYVAGNEAALIYIVNKRRANAPHRISRAVLMSPAGYHHRIPRGCRYLGPWIDWLAKRSGVYSLSVPSEMARNLSRKLMQDAVSLPALRDLIYSVGEMFLGGDFRTMHSHIGVVTDNMVAGTSSKVFIQFWNCYMNKRFLSYDYGAPANLRIYGTDTPVDYMAHYHLIDIPIHFMAGLNDNLIPAKDCFKHYKVLHRVSPCLATCRALAGRGHIDFTYGLDHEIAHEIFTHAAPLRASQSGASTPRTKAVGGEFGSPRGDRQACDTPSPIASLLPTKMRGGAGGRANGGAGEGEGGARGGGGGPLLFGSPGILLGASLKVSGVVPGSPAALSAVVRIGDQVLSVDNVVVVGQPPALVQHALKGKVGSEVTIGFQRKGVHKKAAITRTVTGVEWAEQ